MTETARPLNFIERIIEDDLKNGKVTTMRAYAGGREIEAASTFPYNGYAYFTGKNDGRLYRMPLDGELAQPLSPGKRYAAVVWEDRDGGVGSSTSESSRSGCAPAEPYPAELPLPSRHFHATTSPRRKKGKFIAR